MKQTLTIVVITALVSAALTRFYWPKIQERTVEVQKEVVKADIRTVIRTIERPDGSKETVSETIDRSTSNSTSKKTAEKLASKDYLLAVSAVSKLSKIEPVYGLQLQKRVLGPFYVGVSGNTVGEYGVLVGLEF